MYFKIWGYKTKHGGRTSLICKAHSKECALQEWINNIDEDFERIDSWETIEEAQNASHF